MNKFVKDLHSGVRYTKNITLIINCSLFQKRKCQKETVTHTLNVSFASNLFSSGFKPSTLLFFVSTEI